MARLEDSTRSRRLAYRWMFIDGDQGVEHLAEEDELLRRLEDGAPIEQRFAEAGAPTHRRDRAETSRDDAGRRGVQTPEAKERRPVPRLALDLQDAAEALHMSADHFREHVKPHVKILRAGRRQVIAVRELERFLEERGEQVLG